jgi:hypothetical protein
MNPKTEVRRARGEIQPPQQESRLRVLPRHLPLANLCSILVLPGNFFLDSASRGEWAYWLVPPDLKQLDGIQDAARDSW